MKTGFRINHTALLAATALVVTSLAHAASSASPIPISADGTDPRQWDLSKEGVLAAPQNHKLIYEDGEVRVLLVNVSGGTEEPYHLHPYWSVLLSVAMQPNRLINRAASGAEASNWKFLDLMTSPVWMAMSPPAPLHSIKNVGTTPDRDIRIDFKKGDVPSLIRPDWANGKVPISGDGTDPRSWDPNLDATRISAATNRIIYEDGDIRVQVVSVPAGTSEPARTYPFPAVMVAYGNDGEPRVSVRLNVPQKAKAEIREQALHVIRVEFKRGFPIHT